MKSVHLKLEKSIALKIYEKGKTDVVPAEMDDLEKHTQQREEMGSSELVTMYSTLLRNNKKLKRKATDNVAKKAKKKSVEANKPIEAR